MAETTLFTSGKIAPRLLRFVWSAKLVHQFLCRTDLLLYLSFVMIQGIIGAFGVRIPVSYLMSRTANPTLFRIGLATPSSTFVQIIMCGIAFLMLERKRKKGII